MKIDQEIFLKKLFAIFLKISKQFGIKFCFVFCGYRGSVESSTFLPVKITNCNNTLLRERTCIPELSSRFPFGFATFRTTCQSYQLLSKYHQSGIQNNLKPTKEKQTGREFVNSEYLNLDGKAGK